MSLNTFWLQRMQSALKSRSVIAVVTHWQLTRFKRVHADGSRERCVASHEIGVAACRVYNVHVDAIALHARACVDIEADDWLDGAMVTCAQCKALLKESIAQDIDG